MKHHGFPIPSLWCGPTALDNSHEQGPSYVQFNHVSVIQSYWNNRMTHIYSGRGYGPYGKSTATLVLTAHTKNRRQLHMHLGETGG